MQFRLGKLLGFGLAMVLTSADAIAQTPDVTRQRQGDRAAPMNFQGRYLVSILDNVVQVEKAPYMARFTPDGRHIIVNGLY